MSLKTTSRIFRLLRLFNVVRSHPSVRILKRWEAAAVFVFTYTEISMMRYFVMLVMKRNACLFMGHGGPPRHPGTAD